MSTSLRDAFRQWEEETKASIGRATEVNLSFRVPPIQKLDASLAQLATCQFLSLSSNCIDKLTGLASLKNIRILSLARNNLKDLTGIEGVAETLQQLWVSYNQLDKLKPIQSLTKLTILYIAHNSVKEWGEVGRLSELPVLQDFVFLGNPLAEAMEETAYRTEMAKRLPQIKQLDGDPIIRD